MKMIHLTSLAAAVALTGPALAANIAPDATVTVSSNLSGELWVKEHITDQDLDTAWVAAANAGVVDTVTLTWDTAQSIDEVIFTLGNNGLDSEYWAQSFTLSARDSEGAYQEIASQDGWTAVDENAGTQWTFTAGTPIQTTALRLEITEPSESYYTLANDGDPETDPEADLTGSFRRGRVYELDVQGEAAPVPEPGSLSLLALSGLLIASRPRR